MLQMLKVEKVKQRNQGLESHSASVLERKNEIKVFDLVSLHRVHSHNMSGKESYNFKVFSKLKHNLLGVNGYAKCNTSYL